MILAVWGGAIQADDSLTDAQKLEFFESRIRPVLIKHCYECHSADTETPKGGLLLDSRNGWMEGGDSGPAIVEENPDESVLIEALRYDGFEMPPSGKLPETVIRDFEQWVKMGAPDPRTVASNIKRSEVDVEQGRQFWAFQPPRKHEIPAVENREWPESWIDHFLLARLEEAGLQPAADTDRYRLLRRLSFDLTGLPPAREEIEEFLHDDSPDALSRVVERLLGSRHFGEHWGRHWLDVARYADSNGSDFNATFHQAWRYRNYVIDSFNGDKPFDRFVREQIAGDLLPYDSDEQRAEQLIATGFLMLGAKMLSERDKEKLRMDVVDEQVDTVGRAFMGMTLGCARCHDHKFDPIPADDYYALAGIFRNTVTLKGEIQQYVSHWVRQPLPIDPEHAEALAHYEQQKGELSAKLKEAEQAVQQAEERAAKELLSQKGVLVDDVDAEIIGEWKSSTYSPRFIGKGYLHDDNQGKGEKSVTFVPELPSAGEYEVRLSFAAANGRARNVPVRVVHVEGTAEIELDQQPTPPILNLFRPIGRFSFEAGTAGSVTISTEGTQGHVIADAVHFIRVEDLEEADDADDLQKAVEQAVAGARERVEQLQAEMKALEASAPPPAPVALAVQEEEEIGDSRIRVRGEPHNLGREVPRGFLQVALYDQPSPISTEQSGRRELAEWIADPRHPLTARVIVNRVWAKLMGEGLVRSIDNFGELGERPTHPELLDRLAMEFVEQGWSVKQLVRQIVLSRAYRMQSAHDEASFKVDPENRLLWRAQRRNLLAESIRDSMLAMSDQLEWSMGDSPVKGLGTLVNNNSANAESSQQSETNRRTVYLPIVRNELPDLLTVFDFADPDFVTGRRPVTNVPAQALLLLNSSLVRESALRTAERLLRENTDSDRARRVETVYLTVLGRLPTGDEQQRALDFVQRLTSDLADETETGNSADNAESAPAPLEEKQAWGRLIHALFASTEFRMLD